MIEVTVRKDHGELATLSFDSNAVEVIDGALVIYTQQARDFIAGFAPGQWVRFQNLDVV